MAIGAAQDREFVIGRDDRPFRFHPIDRLLRKKVLR
jgi:hypothetical protein